ncbi:MFS transporter [Vitiosangium sp. GDMCC 1.1324]|uniref:MFS transporter n=1 Tax=Vitiosangium sp. (strain GDMCC 1.1324) TaxID=2138576 RepID=UPI000D37A6B1|nr:MFS transporter [Vitiosangium sp. GDMCC 1.1324]PTL80065.1 MFS transporter [Vitiosangium sp. GDMCC 1.1324]
MRWWPSGGLWRHPDFLRLWGAQIASAFGSRITRTALPIIAILSIQATPTEVAVLSALSVAPGVFVGLFAGGHIDRTAKRPLLVGADLVRALLIFTIPFAAWLGVLSMPQLYVVAATVGAATTLFQIADNSFLPALVGTGLLVEGNAKLEATDSIAEAAGPGLAGVLIQALTAPVVVILDALSYLWSAFMLSRIRATEQPATVAESGTSVFGDMKIGFRASLAHPLVGPTLISDAIMYFFGGFFLALYMFLALETLGLSPATVGLIISVGGVGAFAGALIANPLGRLVGMGSAMAISLGVGQAANLFIALALHARTLAIPFLVLQQLIGDALLGAYVVHSISLRQRVLPHAVLGRANATFHVVTGLMLPAGALLAGPLAGALGISPAIWIGACGGLLAVPVLLRSQILQLR